MLILTGALDRSELYDTITQTVCKVPLFHVRTREGAFLLEIATSYKIVTLQRKGDDSTRPLAAHILDLMTLFLTSNLRSKFPVDDYAHALTIVEQVIYALRRNQCRLPYMEWAGTYAALVTVLKYCLVHFDRLREQSTDISYILEKVGCS